MIETGNHTQLVEMDLAHLLHPMQGRDHNTSGPTVFVRGRGALIEDAAGKEYLDAFSGLWNVNAGHGRVELAEAASEQMSTLAFTSGFAGSSNAPAIHLAARLAWMAPGDLTATFFTTGGAESVETAIKVARFYWRMVGRPEKTKIISRQQGYHGLTASALSATGIPQFWTNFGPLEPGHHHIPTHYCYRCAWRGEYPACGLACAEALEQAIVAESAGTVAAFLAEPVQGAGGSRAGRGGRLALATRLWRKLTEGAIVALLVCFFSSPLREGYGLRRSDPPPNSIALTDRSK